MKKERTLGWAMLLSVVLSGPAWGQVKWLTSIDQAKQEAQQSRRFVLVHFWSETCIPCRQLERDVFGQAPFANAMHANFVPVKINLSLLPDVGREYGITSIPTDLILAPDGRVLHRMTSPQDMQQYIASLNQVSAHSRLLMNSPTQIVGAPPQHPPSTAVPPTGQEMTNPYIGNAANQFAQQQQTMPANGPYPGGQRPAGPPTGASFQGPGPQATNGYPQNQPMPNQYGSQPPVGGYAAGQHGGGQYIENPFFRQPPGAGPRPNMTGPSLVGTNGNSNLPAGPGPQGNGQAMGVPPQRNLPGYVENQFANRPPANQGPPAGMPNGGGYGPGPAATSPQLPVESGMAANAGGNIYSGGAPQPAAGPRTNTGGSLAGAPGGPGMAGPGMAGPGMSGPVMGGAQSSANTFQSGPPQGYTPNLPTPDAPISSADANRVAANGAPNNSSPNGMPAATPPSPQNPQLSMDGYCPVSLVDQRAWVKGDVKHGAVHRGRTFLFASAENQQRFLSDPDKYSPMLAGYDPVSFAEKRTFVEGRREHGVTYQDHVYLFASEESLQQFWKAPEQYVPVVQQAMQQSESGRSFVR